MTSPINLSAFTIGPPTVVAELDVGKLGGELQRLAWSLDASQLYVQTAEGAARHHFIVTLDGGRKVLPIASEPEWAATYWALKSGLTAPGATDFTIAVVKDNVQRRSSFLGGAPNLAGSIERDSTPEFDPVVIYRIYDEEVGRWVNEPPVNGRTYGWGPYGTGFIAFVDARGRVTLRNPRVRQALPGVADAAFPSWTADGAKLAFVQKIGRKKYRLILVTLTSAAP